MQKRLTLKKETLKNLSIDQLRNVAGGAVVDPALGQLASAADSAAGCNFL